MPTVFSVIENLCNQLEKKGINTQPTAENPTPAARVEYGYTAGVFYITGTADNKIIYSGNSTECKNYLKTDKIKKYIS